MRSLDHDERRRHIADVAVRLIAGEGLEAVTIRRIAAELGCSTTVVTHYFKDKHELLLWAYRTLGEFGQEGRGEGLASGSPDLLGYLMAMCAASDTNKAYWRAYVAIWDRSLSDASISAELNSWTKAVLSRLEELIQMSAGECNDPALVARRLLAMVQGISVQVLFDHDSWSPDQVRAVLAAEVQTLLEKKTPDQW